ncbi:Pantothenate kinase type III, CoaX-like [Helicobacter heilmannii]|uniref:type III pantothenate kinase n=1 Tax=Helicobacter heilmannii TaxID=35817 RepID=UPI0006A22C67|nr:type III pantothenate kinase [Helicobacter heilmannii]CRF49430.1 Pantothenate kinase type III, CoaX-like [Helicobacter heilmannii]
MTLCDIGNTHLHFYKAGRVWACTPQNLATHQEALQGEVFYISVNPESTNALLELCPSATDLAPKMQLKSKYEGLGVDRIAACLGLCGKSGVVVDAGSAITIDVMESRVHLGGVILPGFESYRHAFQHISPALDLPLNLRVDLQSLPNATADALGYGALQSVLLTLKHLVGERKVYFTGGDGKFLANFFSQGIYDGLLVFHGMRATLGA